MKKTILINILVLFVLLIILELFCSLAFYVKDEKNPLMLSGSVVDFPYVYYTFIPEKKNNSVIVNDDGLYTNYNRNKPQNTIRIVLIGGSTARGMLSTNTISGSLGKLLKNELPGKNIEVINAGMSGYVVEQLFIFYQLIISKYSPDIVVGLNGYNDLMSIKLNRYSGLYFAPQNMLQFQVIRESKYKKTIIGRIANILPSAFRMVNFIKRQFLRQSQYDYSAFNDEKIEEASSLYISIIRDMHDFCKARGVVYLEFLQPIRWYVKMNGQEKINYGQGVSSQLIKLYGFYEKGLTELSYGYSLADLFKEREELYRDDCHVSDTGNEILASAMLKPIMEELMKLRRL